MFRNPEPLHEIRNDTYAPHSYGVLYTTPPQTILTSTSTVLQKRVTMEAFGPISPRKALPQLFGVSTEIETPELVK